MKVDRAPKSCEQRKRIPQPFETRMRHRDSHAEAGRTKRFTIEKRTKYGDVLQMNEGRGTTSEFGKYLGLVCGAHICDHGLRDHQIVNFHGSINSNIFGLALPFSLLRGV